MDTKEQQRYRPMLEKRLEAVKDRILEVAPAERSGVASAFQTPAGGASPDIGVLVRPNVKLLLDERLRLELALQRIEGGYFGRCIRCGGNMPRHRLDEEPEALFCGECRPRIR